MVNKSHESGLMIYPKAEWRKLMFKAPLTLWRMGWGPLLGRQFVVLTTTGRKSGLPRHTMTEYALVNNCIVVASGWGARAQWVKNLAADPLVTAQIATGIHSCRARRIDDAPILREVYHKMHHSPAFDPSLKLWGIDPPTLDNLLAHIDRAYFFILEPTAQPTPAPLEADLRWVNGALFVALLLGWVAGRRASR